MRAIPGGGDSQGLIADYSFCISLVRGQGEDDWIFQSGENCLLHPVGIFKIAVAPVGIDTNVCLLDFLGYPILNYFLAAFVGDDIFEQLKVFGHVSAVCGMAFSEFNDGADGLSSVVGQAEGGRYFPFL